MPKMDVLCVGSVNLDTIAVVERLPGRDERIMGETVLEAGGGPAATAAVALARQGLRVGFCGVVGDDDAGRRGLAMLEAEGVDVSTSVIERGRPSPRSVVIVETGSPTRSIIVTESAAPQPSAIPAGIAEWYHADQTGYAAVVASAEREPLRISLDAGNPIAGLRLDRVELYAPTLGSLLQRYPGTSPVAALRAAAAEGPRLVVATSGAAGAYAFEADRAAKIPAFAEPVLSTLGAGDVFHGALLAAVLQGLDLVAAVQRASAVALLSCRGLDGRSAIPDAAQTDAYLRETAAPPPELATEEEPERER